MFAGRGLEKGYISQTSKVLRPLLALFRVVGLFRGKGLGRKREICSTKAAPRWAVAGGGRAQPRSGGVRVRAGARKAPLARPRLHWPKQVSPDPPVLCYPQKVASLFFFFFFSLTGGRPCSGVYFLAARLLLQEANCHCIGNAGVAECACEVCLPWIWRFFTPPFFRRCQSRPSNFVGRRGARGSGR